MKDNREEIIENEAAGQVRAENKMGTMPVNKLLLSIATPMIISMIVQALYNVVDSIYVSCVGEYALTGVSLAFPAQMLITALGVGLATGLNSVLSKALGEKNQEDVDNSASMAILLSAVAYIIMLICSFTAIKPYFAAETDDPMIFDAAVSYLQICMGCSFGVFGQFLFERFLVSTGKTVYSMMSQGFGAIINIILDPIFIFGYFGLPAMGTAGAAVATVIGQCCAWVLAMFLNVRFNKEITFKVRLKPDFAMIKRILKVGIPSTLMQAVGSVMITGMNMILLNFTSTAAAVFGVYFKLQSFFFMPIFGLNSGVVPIVAYNYGARKKDRMIKTMKLGTLYAVCFMMLGLLIFQTIPDKLLLLFNASDNMIEIGSTALRIISISYIFAGFCIMFSTIFQALGNGVYSMVISFFRQLIVLIPAAYLLSLTGRLEAVWWSFPIAEVAAVIASVFFMVKMYKNVIKPIGD